MKTGIRISGAGPHTPVDSDGKSAGGLKGVVPCRRAAIPHAAPCPIDMRLVAEVAVSHTADAPPHPYEPASIRAVGDEGMHDHDMIASQLVRRYDAAAWPCPASAASAARPPPRR